MNLVGHTGRIQRWVAILLVTSAFVGCIGGEDIGLDRWTTDPANPERVQHYDGTGNLADRVPEQVGETVHELTGYQGAEPTTGITDSGAVFGTAGDQLIRSTDHGETWEVVNEIGEEVTVTDAGELGIGFLGTEDTDAGPDQAPEDARWHLYNVVSLDQGTGSPTFTSHQVTPDEDPVQVGRICTGGVGCGEKRNLLEFIDNDVHPDGTLYTIYTEGCVDDCAEDPDGEKSTAREIAWARLDGVTFTTDEASQGDEPALDTAPDLARPR